MAQLKVRGMAGDGRETWPSPCVSSADAKGVPAPAPMPMRVSGEEAWGRGFYRRNRYSAAAD